MKIFYLAACVMMLGSLQLQAVNFWGGVKAAFVLAATLGQGAQGSGLVLDYEAYEQRCCADPSNCSLMQLKMIESGNLCQETTTEKTKATTTESKLVVKSRLLRGK